MERIILYTILVIIAYIGTLILGLVLSVEVTKLLKEKKIRLPWAKE